MHAKQSIRLLMILAVGASTVSAFKDTHPLVAFSSIELPSLSLLSSLPSPVFYSSSSPVVDNSQTTFPPTDSPPTSDLCSLESILVISLPGLHFSDLTLLPSSTGSGINIKSVLAAATSRVNQALTIPYISSRSTGSAKAVRKLVAAFKKECKAVVETPEGEKKFWQGDEAKKVVRVEVLKGLEEWELVGTKAREMRKTIVGSLDSLVQSHLHTLRQPYLVILTSLPSTSLSTLTSPVPKNPKLVKRQFYDNDGEEIYDSEAEESAAKNPLLSHNDIELETTDSAFAPNATSIFAIPPNSGLLHRYVFFTSPIIFALLVSLLLLIPVVVYSSSALTSIETVAGLEQKMTGTVGLDPSKA